MDAFDEYNSKDIVIENADGVSIARELLYAQRMTKKLLEFSPEANEYVQLAARCQHIGRWEISRSLYPMDKKGYLQWRNTLKIHHSSLASSILKDCSYTHDEIIQVSNLLLKKELHRNTDTQILEDVICLVFIEYYLEDFANKQEDFKMIDIIRKTMRKMSPTALQAVSLISLSSKIKLLIHDASR